MPKMKPHPPEARELIEEMLNAWRINNRIDLLLLSKIPAKGFTAVPPGSRGRNVARQFVHLNKARVGWLKFNGERIERLPQFPSRRAKGFKEPTRAQLISACRITGKAIERYLEARLASGRRIQFFRGSPVRWLVYMVAHESHHRGAILLTLKQNRMRVPEAVALKTVWMPWYFGKA